MNFCGLPKGGHDNPLEKAKRPGIFGRLLGKIGASAVYPCVSILVCLPYRVWSSYARRHRSSQRILSTAVDGFLGPASASSTWALEARPAPAESTGDKCDGFPATNVTVFWALHQPLPPGLWRPILLLLNPPATNVTVSRRQM